MKEHTFIAKIISGHRLTVRGDAFDDLELIKGDKVKVVLSKVEKQELGTTVM